MKVLSIQANQLSTREPDRQSFYQESEDSSERLSDDYISTALWFTKEIQREYVGTSTISTRE